MRRIILVLCAAALSGGAALAQLALPSADTPAAASPSSDSPAAKPKHRAPRRSGSFTLAADPEDLDGKTLRQNGRNGELRFVKGADGSLKIVKFSLLGEVISNPSQRCRIDIVADATMDATPQGEPDGLPRFAAKIPACPLSFDVVADGAIVPPQANACVFAAADCQASPSGLWGPDPADFEKDPKAITRARSAADRSIQDSLHALERRDKDAAPSLTREESDFAAERDDVCHDYATESKLAFCASRLQQTRAALLAKRLAEASPAKGGGKGGVKKRRK